MDSNFVIKVKYGDTLRRFNAYMNGNGSLDLDMGELRVKILDLFKFSPDADLTLTYIDEDNDIVTLVDDDDLRDAISQSLHPLRINVLLNSNRDGRSSTSSTPMRTPRTQAVPLSQVNSNVSNVLKSVPEPVRDALSKLSYDLMSKAAVSAPVLTEIVECLSKLGLSHLGSVPVPQFQGGSTSNAPSGVCGSPTKGQEASTESGPILKSNSPYVNPIASINLKNRDGKIVPGGVGTTASVGLNRDLPKDSSVPRFPYVPSTICPVLGSSGLAGDRKQKIQKETECHPSGKTFASTSLFPASLVDHPMHPQPHLSPVCVPPFPSTFSPGILRGNNSVQQPSGIGNSSTSQVGFNAQNSFPINGQTGADVSDILLSDGLHRVHPFKRSYSHYDSMGNIFHKGVRCDACGVSPITGPRFKSKIKDDYDLCGVCFSEVGNEAEYTRMDYPLQCPYVMRRYGLKSSRPKLDSRFIKDVNVMDGTIMAPMTSFTKIWRIFNNGTIVWPQGTQLVWIGGAKLTDKVSVELEIPEEGIHFHKELDIAVDFTAPESPGRYISYWRMALPSGEKFGQGVWVLIQVQVDTSIEGSLVDDFLGLNLNLPPESSEAEAQNLIDVNMDPFDCTPQEFQNPDMSTDLVKAMAEKHPKDDQELDPMVKSGLLISNDALVPVSPEMSAPMSYPIIDFSAGPLEPASAPDVPTTFTEEVTDGNMVEETLLKELEEMGFDLIDLNKEVLRKNEYNLEQSVDELCGIAEWDPILEELLEMGFSDKEKNKKLLIKNGGSIKRVVMDLIAGEKRE